MAYAVNGWDIAIVLVLLYAAAVYLLYRRGWIGPAKSLTLFGPALMVKTQRGRGLLERWGSHRRFWTIAADLGIVLAAVAMVTIVVLLVLDAIVATRVPASAAPTASAFIR